MKLEQLKQLIREEVRKVLKEGVVKALYIHKQDYDKANEIRMKNKLSVSEDAGGSRGGYYAVNAPSGYATFEKSLNDPGGKDWEKFIKLVKGSKLKYKEVIK